jgi:hypothetical protein
LAGVSGEWARYSECSKLSNSLGIELFSCLPILSLSKLLNNRRISIMKKYIVLISLTIGEWAAVLANTVPI